ncbi:hypothetical protein KUL25_15155 [Rhodobacteraceae bacterium N5(2021)]|uniref:Secreted protein n=1 Tax=Gymnodinialimonas phycosphaerae TaxID=2841589 RepID=A0A975YEY5_9RHOB|nr:hypothetical protein [Gymnodinialimonas phycosphaerae]MBY4894096.1 hypothetical protein [Gymnodinialimonas phycosphaerae]
MNRALQHVTAAVFCFLSHVGLASATTLELATNSWDFQTTGISYTMGNNSVTTRAFSFVSDYIGTLSQVNVPFLVNVAGEVRGSLHTYVDDTAPGPQIISDTQTLTATTPPNGVSILSFFYGDTFLVTQGETYVFLIEAFDDGGEYQWLRSGNDFGGENWGRFGSGNWFDAGAGFPAAQIFLTVPDVTTPATVPLPAGGLLLLGGVLMLRRRVRG